MLNRDLLKVLLLESPVSVEGWEEGTSPCISDSRSRARLSPFFDRDHYFDKTKAVGQDTDPLSSLSLLTFLAFNVRLNVRCEVQGLDKILQMYMLELSMHL
jgi:hypothetical protein